MMENNRMYDGCDEGTRTKARKVWNGNHRN